MPDLVEAGLPAREPECPGRNRPCEFFNGWARCPNGHTYP